MRERRVETETAKRIRAKRNGRFIRGPIPLPWMQKAMEIPGASCLKVCLALWYREGFRNDEIKVSSKLLYEFGIPRRSGYEALYKLEKRGLISVVRNNGIAPRVKILQVEPQNSDCQSS